ncbi:MAG: hypothetical protein FWC79_02460 [Oscillospiraceae bacterium]|nr:hypothetical protein [Oscillospiraceae bacterium]
MKEDTKEKTLVSINENSMFYKIKVFFKDLFKRNNDSTHIVNSSNTSNVIKESENTKNVFMENIKNIEDEETKLLKLQKQYRAGEIQEEDLTIEQTNSLCALFDKQIATLKKSNEMRRQRILDYKRKVQTDS